MSNIGYVDPVEQLAGLKAEIRQVFADYYASEGCSCCQEADAHREAANKLGELLDCEKYDDDSGYQFYKYRTKGLKNAES